MEFLAPKKIHITSCGQVVEFVSETKKVYLYKYVKSFTNLGKKIELDEKYLKEQLSNYFVALEFNQEPEPEIIKASEVKKEIEWEQPEIIIKPQLQVKIKAAPVKATKPVQGSLF